jgi:hypothetical protein
MPTVDANADISIDYSLFPALIIPHDLVTLRSKDARYVFRDLYTRSPGP